ncbi:MAG: Gfo/Idh/MocA family oxidoreductase [Armatimonadetes bacterium]|nr:Gfo/Idh/MocA family oxidoreductase [Armatimonadota bacterium]
MKQVRVGIVGMGIGRPNAQAIARDPRGVVAALCDLVPERMDDFAKALPAPVRQFTDYKKLCADPDLDAIFVGTPNQLHVPIALEAVRNGKHVLVTKPLSDSLAAARKLVEAQEAAGVVGMMSLSTRYANNTRYLGALAQKGDLGEVYYARARSVRRAGIPAWNLGFITKGGGAFRDMGVHVLDSAWWLMGLPKPASVVGVAGMKFGQRGQGYWDFTQPPKETWSKFAVDDYGGGFIRFENGAGLQVESFWASHMPGEVQIELFGTEAGATLNPLKLFRTVGGAPQDVTVNLPKGPEPWDNLAGHWLDCILDGVQCEAPLRHGMVVQEMLEALLRSGETGKEVRVKGE